MCPPTIRASCSRRQVGLDHPHARAHVGRRGVHDEPSAVIKGGLRPFTSSFGFFAFRLCTATLPHALDSGTVPESHLRNVLPPSWCNRGHTVIVTKGRIQPRDISADEINVIRATLDVSGTSTQGSALEELRIVSICGCGCASVDFVEHDPKNRAGPLAQAIGKTITGGTVGIIVWGTTDQVTGLEIYDLGAGQHDLTLPVPTSIEPFPITRDT